MSQDVPPSDGVEVEDDSSSLLLVGLDGEMSSADIESGGRLIQAGAAAWRGEPGGPVDVFSSLIRHDDMAWSERAAQVHGITREQVSAAPPAAEVDEALRTWLLDHGAVDGRRCVVPIGLNVGSFDMPFFRQSLPATSMLISRRAVDLNALCFTFDGWDPNPAAGSVRDFFGWKRSMKGAANKVLARSGVEVSEHDAGFDAAQALIGWWWLRRQMVDVTRRVASLDARLDALDPLRSTLGDGLLDRLGGVDQAVLYDIVACLPSGVVPRRWFGTKHSDLGGTPLEGLLAGRIDDVLSAARSR